ncbi:permease [Alicyclobacillus dauci]|uniref:Permease n=1 Tax=Alicyclobacillus dauci TaxID=1475485 RepID=A0ABY6Z8I6_9BACL|nr:permease [Alicyclobacillus dauci]WAH39040.1 permease [Alicyclobacillus dauci]
MDKVIVYLSGATVLGYCVAALWRPTIAAAGLESTFEMFWQALPWIVVSMFAAGLLSQIIQPKMVAHLFGRDTGVAGILLAAVLGVFGTGSRWAVYPLAAGLLAADATPGAVFAFMTSWQLVSIPRLPAEVPFLGIRYTIVRAAISILTAFVGGLIFDMVWDKLPPQNP